MSAFTDPKIKALFKRYRELTGIDIRIPGFLHERQAHNFLAHYEMRDLEMVVSYVRAQIYAGENQRGGGMNRMSLQWKCMFGQDEEISTFQDRHGLASEWAKRHRKDLLPEEPKPEPKPAPQPVSDDERARLAETVRQMAGNLFKGK